MKNLFSNKNRTAEKWSIFFFRKKEENKKKICASNFLQKWTRRKKSTHTTIYLLFPSLCLYHLLEKHTYGKYVSLIFHLCQSIWKGSLSRTVLNNVHVTCWHYSKSISLTLIWSKKHRHKVRIPCEWTMNNGQSSPSEKVLPKS